MEEKDLVTADVQEEKAEKPKNDVRKKILILVILLLCVGVLVALVIFHSGIPLVDFWTVAGSVDPVETEIAEVKKIEGVLGTRVARRGTLALYEGLNAEGKRTQSVVHLASGTVMVTLADTDAKEHEVTLREASGAAWYSVETVTKGESPLYSIALYDDGGKSFAAKENLAQSAYNDLDFESVLDLVRFENKVYRLQEGERARQAFTIGTFSRLPDFDRKVGSYYFVEQKKDVENGIAEARFVYNEKGVLTATCHVPTAAVKESFFYLSDGTLLLQYVTLASEHSEEYTYVEKNQKYTLHHLLISARDGARTELDAPEFYITNILSDKKMLAEGGLNTSIANLAWGYHVNSELLDTSDHCLSSVLLSNRGRITSEVGDIIPAMYGGVIYGVAKNRWVAINLADECFLLNEWGAVVGAFPGLDAAGLEVAQKLFVYGQSIYDWDLELLYDMKENGIVSHRLVGSSVLMYKENGEVLLFDPEEKEATVILAADSDASISVQGGALIVALKTVNGKKQYAFYNEHNTHLVTLTADAVTATSYEIDGSLIVELLVTVGDSTELYLATVED